MDDSMPKSLLKNEVRLRQLELQDAECMLEWLRNPDIYSKMQYDPASQNIEKCRNFIEKSWTDKENLHYAITNKKSEYLGTVSLKNIDRKNSSAEFAVVLHPKAMGMGVGTVALEAIMEIAFVQLELNKVYLYVRSDNERAVVFYKKNHLEYEGCFKEHLKVGNVYKDIYWYALRKRKYLSWKQAMNLETQVDKSDFA